MLCILSGNSKCYNAWVPANYLHAGQQRNQISPDLELWCYLAFHQIKLPCLYNCFPTSRRISRLNRPSPRVTARLSSLWTVNRCLQRLRAGRDPRREHGPATAPRPQRTAASHLGRLSRPRAQQTGHYRLSIGVVRNVACPAARRRLSRQLMAPFTARSRPVAVRRRPPGDTGRR